MKWTFGGLVNFISNKYDPRVNVAGSIHGKTVSVSSTDMHLLKLIEMQQAEIDTLKGQVARLLSASRDV